MSQTILIIEDDFFLRGLEETKLNKEGYNILAAKDSVETYAILKVKHQIDLILLDLMLPEVDGFTVLKEIKKNELYKNTPVIVFTNLSEEEDKKKARAIGINEFLVKSNFDLKQLTKKIKELID